MAEHIAAGGDDDPKYKQYACTRKRQKRNVVSEVMCLAMRETHAGLGKEGVFAKLQDVGNVEDGCLEKLSCGS